MEIIVERIKLFDPLSELTSLIVSKQIIQLQVIKCPSSSFSTPLVSSVLVISDDISRSLISPKTSPIMTSFRTDHLIFPHCLNCIFSGFAN